MNYYVNILEISKSLFLQYLLGTAVIWNIIQQRSISSLFLARQPPVDQGLLIHQVSRSHTTTVGRTSLDVSSARRRDLYLTTHNIHNRETSMPSVGFEPTNSAGEWLQTALDGAATGIGGYIY